MGGGEQAYNPADSSVPSPRQDCPDALRRRFELSLNRAAHRRRKEAFGELFVAYGRSLKSDLLLAQWYHKYDLNPWDERCLLPDALWARDEDCIWYSQGGHKGYSCIEHGHLADMGLPARYIYEAGGGYQLDGTPRKEGLPQGHPGVRYVPSRPWGPDLVKLDPQQPNSAEWPVYPPLPQDPHGRQFLQNLEALLGGARLRTDAPWFVRMRAWLPQQRQALVLHRVNYRQVEDSDIEVPLPVGPLAVELEAPAAVERLEWIYPERQPAQLLPFEATGSRARFTVPQLIVYGMSVLYLKTPQE